MGNFASTQDTVINYLIIGVFAFSIFLVVKSIFTPVKKVKAVVIDKHKFETPSKNSPTGKQVNYIVVFLVNGKKKSFYVSSFGYDTYKINKKGTLKYKGRKLINFK